MPRDGHIGEEIFQQVEEHVKNGLNRTQAFAQISEDTGRQAGTVAANYYRVARARAGGSVPKKERTGQTQAKRNTGRKAVAKRSKRTSTSNGRRRAGAGGSGSDLEHLTAELLQSTRALTDAATNQQREISDLRRRLDGVRELLG